MKEQFECANCWHSGPLNTHGGCEHCGSKAVISRERIESPPVPSLPGFIDHLVGCA